MLDRIQFDYMALQMAAAATSAASGAAGIVARDVPVLIIGVPVDVILFAVAGAAGILAFLPPMPLPRAFGSVVLATFAGAGGSVPAATWLVGHDYAEFSGSHQLVALAVAALVQLTLPLLIARMPNVIDRLVGRRADKDSNTGGQP